MNQILSVEMPKNRPGSYKKSNKSDIKTIIIFFCVILILFAIIVAVIGFNILNKEEKAPNESNTVITGTEPDINIEILSEEKLKIIVSHDKQISSIVYNWNDGDKIEQTDIGEETKEIEVEIPAGTNTLNVSVTDINGVVKNHNSQYTGTEIIEGPRLVLENDNGNIKISAQSNVEIAYISYNWDGEEEKQIQINDVKTEQIIEVPEGEHTLNVVLVDMNGGETTDAIKTKGDLKPTLDIKRDANNTNIYINATDDEGLLKMTIQDFNTGKIDEYEISGTEYYKAIPLKEGENKLIITVYNINEIKIEKRIGIVK